MSSAESAAVLDALRRIIRFLRLADREAEVNSGLSAAQLFVVHALAGGPARSMAELAERTLTDQSSVSIVVSRLEAKKLITRRVSKLDRRRVELSLSPTGKKIVEAGPGAPQTKMIAAIEAMPVATRKQLIKSLTALVTAFGAGDLEPLMMFEEEPRKR